MRESYEFFARLPISGDDSADADDQDDFIFNTFTSLFLRTYAANESRLPVCVM